jgi:hypothetical protein
MQTHPSARAERPVAAVVGATKAPSRVLCFIDRQRPNWLSPASRKSCNLGRLRNRGLGEPPRALYIVILVDGRACRDSVRCCRVSINASRTSRRKKSTLLRRGTSPEEIAAAVRFILDAPAMTGQMIALDGGQHLAWSSAERRLLPAVADRKR